MNKLILASLFVFAAGSASAQLSASSTDRSGWELAQDQAAPASKVDPSYATYRRVVLGDNSVILSAIAKPVDESGRWVAGPYARYLIQVNGIARTEALAQAHRNGESPSFVANESRRVARQFSPYEQYQRWVLGRSDSDIEASRAGARYLEADADPASTRAR